MAGTSDSTSDSLGMPSELTETATDGATSNTSARGDTCLRIVALGDGVVGVCEAEESL